MKQSKLNGFLEFSFKIGKGVSSIFLILILLVILSCGIGLVCSSFQKVETPSFEKVKVSFEEAQNQENENYKEENTAYNTASEDTKIKSYEKDIKNIIKTNNLNERVESDIENYLFNIPDKYKKQYLQGLNIFCQNALKYIDTKSNMRNAFIEESINVKSGYFNWYEFNKASSNIKQLGIYNYHISNGLVIVYNSLFNKNLNASLAEFEANMVKRIVLGCIMGVSLLLFTILLFLPVLIKIEENTRYYKQNEYTNENLSNNNSDNNENENDENDDTKICPKCGKTIKKIAKKCRYCNEWLDNKDGE